MTRPAVFKKSLSSGQTLTEILISLAIFSIVLVPFISSILNLTASHLRYQHQIKATQLARENLEIAYNLFINRDPAVPWSNFISQFLDQDYWHPSPSAINLIPGTEEKIYGRFERKIIFSQDPQKPGTINLRSQVNWQERGKPQEVVLETSLINFSSLTL